jgi:multiple sugar transport system permease protein
MLRSTLDRVAQILRGLVAILAAAIVLWSFYWVFSRPFRLADESVGQVTLVVMNWGGGGGQKEEEIVDSIIKEFESLHPSISINRINPGSAEDFNTKLQTMMAAGVTPDVFYLGSENFSKFAVSGHLAKIEPLIAADVAAGRETIDLDDYFQSTIDNFRFDGDRSGRGDLFGIPKDFTTWGFYYNKDLFDQAEVPYPKDDWTWDDFHAAAQAIGKLPGVLGGTEFNMWSPCVRGYLWTYGLDLVDEEFNSRLFEPAVLERLKVLRSWRFEEDNTMVSGDSQVAQGHNVFVTGKVGMVGPLGRWVVPQYRDITAFDWDFAPLPRGTESSNIVATVAWGMNAHTKHQDEAWLLLKHLSGAAGQSRVAELGLAIPTQRSIAYSNAFIKEDQRPLNDQAFLDAAEVARVPSVPGYSEWKAALDRALDASLRSGKDMEQQFKILEDQWQRDRENPLRVGDFPKVAWGRISLILSSTAAVLVLFMAWRWWRNRPGIIALAEEVAGYGFVGPWVVGFIAFMGFPILLSLLLAFSTWNGFSELTHAKWVGWSNFRTLLFEDDRFWTSLRVTGYFALFAVPLGQAISLGLALLLNHNLRASGLFRSALYLPSVLAGVGVALLWRWVFDGNVGLINTYFLNPILEPIGYEAPKWFTGDAAWFGPPAFAVMSFWALGGTMVIYLAGLKGIPIELYEAASIDGTNIFQRFRNVTLPMLSPVILFNFIMAIIGSFQVFTQAFIMTNGGPGDDTRFYVLYLFNLAFDDSHMGYASAMAWILLIIILSLTLASMYVSRKAVYYEALK